MNGHTDQDIKIGLSVALAAAGSALLLAVVTALLFVPWNGLNLWGSTSPRAQVYFRVNDAGVGLLGITALAPLIQAARAHPEATIVLAPYYDKDKDLSRNLQLAQRRTTAVVEMLTYAGLPRDRVVQLKPQAVEPSIDLRRGRRVEVSLQQ